MAVQAFVLAFAHKGGGGAGSTQHEMAQNLRNLLDTALKGKPRLFSRQLSVSVAPGGVMFALLDDEPKRALELCEAVASQLQVQVQNRHVAPAMCAVITHGLLRDLDVLGCSANFEGWPAIAAARVLAKLSPGELAVEASAAEAFSALCDQCGEVMELPGKAHDVEPFQVRLHRRIRFPTPPRVRPAANGLPAEAKAEVSVSVPLASYEAVAQDVKARIRHILDEPYMQCLGDSLVAQGQGKAAEDVLVPAQPGDLLRAVFALHRAAQSCLPQLTEPPLRTQVVQGIETLLGLQVLLVVDRQQLQAQQLAFDPQQSGIQKDIPLQLEIGIEVLVSSLRDEPASFVLRYDSRKQHRVMGRDSLPVDDTLEHGLSHRDQLKGILQHIWADVMKPEAIPTTFDPHETSRLRARLENNEERWQHCYYISIPMDPAHALRADQTLLNALTEVLKPWRVLKLVGAHSAGLLLTDEYRFHDAVEVLLQLLQDEQTGDA
jgi:hypothetical protein